MLFITILLALACIAGIVTIVIILRRGAYEEDGDDAEAEEEEPEEPDPEEKLIDDYFIRQNKDLSK